MVKQPIQSILNNTTKFLVSGIVIDNQNDILNFKNNSQELLNNIQVFINEQ